MSYCMLRRITTLQHLNTTTFTRVRPCFTSAPSPILRAMSDATGKKVVGKLYQYEGE